MENKSSLLLISMYPKVEAYSSSSVGFKMRFSHFQNDPAATSGGRPGGGGGGAEDPDQRGGGELGGERGEGTGRLVWMGGQPTH